MLGSGDLFTPDDCLRMLEETGCDGIMIARGALGNPWIFRQVLELEQSGRFTPVSTVERADTIEKHLNLFIEELRRSGCRPGDQETYRLVCQGICRRFRDPPGSQFGPLDSGYTITDGKDSERIRQPGPCSR